MTDIKRHVASFAQTFVATSLATLGTEIVAIPTDSLLDIHTWTTAFIAGLIIGAVRSAVKVAWEKMFVPA